MSEDSFRYTLLKYRTVWLFCDYTWSNYRSHPFYHAHCMHSSRNGWWALSSIFRPLHWFWDRPQLAPYRVPLFPTWSSSHTYPPILKFKSFGWNNRDMRRFAVRQRPLQPSKRIRVYHLSADGSFISETGERVIASLYDLDDCVSGLLSLCLWWEIEDNISAGLFAVREGIMWQNQFRPIAVFLFSLTLRCCRS